MSQIDTSDTAVHLRRQFDAYRDMHKVAPIIYCMQIRNKSGAVSQRFQVFTIDCVDNSPPYLTDITAAVHGIIGFNLSKNILSGKNLNPAAIAMELERKLYGSDLSKCIGASRL